MIIVTLELNCGANSLVTQLALPSVSNKNVQGSNPHSPNYQIIKNLYRV